MVSSNGLKKTGADDYLLNRMESFINDVLYRSSIHPENTLTMTMCETSY